MKQTRKENIVLVADDDLFIRKVIRKGLHNLAVTVEEVIEGGAVLEAYQHLMPDVLILDIHLPGRSGIELLNDIIAIDPDAYIIMISADSTAENVARVKDRGIKGFLTKPIDKNRLCDFVNQCTTIRYDDITLVEAQLPKA